MKNSWKRTSMLLVALIVGTNAVIFAQLANDRSGAPRFAVALGENEVRLPYRDPSRPRDGNFGGEDLTLLYNDEAWMNQHTTLAGLQALNLCTAPGQRSEPRTNLELFGIFEVGGPGYESVHFQKERAYQACLSNKAKAIAKKLDKLPNCDALEVQLKNLSHLVLKTVIIGDKDLKSLNEPSAQLLPIRGLLSKPRCPRPGERSYLYIKFADQVAVPDRFRKVIRSSQVSPQSPPNLKVSVEMGKGLLLRVADMKF